MNLISFLLCRDLEQRKDSKLFILWDAGLNTITASKFPFVIDFKGIAFWQKEPLDVEQEEFSIRIIDGSGKDFAPITKSVATFKGGLTCNTIIPMLFEFKVPGLYRFDFFWRDRHREGWLLEILEKKI